VLGSPDIYADRCGLRHDALKAEPAGVLDYHATAAMGYPAPDNPRALNLEPARQALLEAASKSQARPGGLPESSKNRQKLSLPSDRNRE